MSMVLTSAAPAASATCWSAFRVPAALPDSSSWTSPSAVLNTDPKQQPMPRPVTNNGTADAAELLGSNAVVASRVLHLTTETFAGQRGSKVTNVPAEYS